MIIDEINEIKSTTVRSYVACWVVACLNRLFIALVLVAAFQLVSR